MLLSLNLLRLLRAVAKTLANKNYIKVTKKVFDYLFLLDLLKITTSTNR